MLTCPRSSLSFHSNAHHHGSLPQQLGVVWDLLLKADPEGPSPIFHAALRHRFHTHTGTPSHVSLQHTLVNKVTPVTLPPGRLKLLTRPSPTGSPPIPHTSGIVAAADFAASAEPSPPAATITATCLLTRSAASAAMPL